MCAKLAILGAEPLGSTPDGYGAFMAKEVDRWAGTIRESGVKLV